MSPRLKNIFEWAYCIIIAVVLALLFRYYIGTPTVVKQVSMFNTLEENDRLLLSRWTRTVKGKYNRGDIITFEAPTNSLPTALEINMDNPTAIYENSKKGFFAKFSYNVLEIGKLSYIKRIIGVAGDHIKIEDGKVYLNNQEFDEPYIRDGVQTTSSLITEVTVPEGYVFVMGDNREHSTDSRAFGCIPINKIESKVWIRFWPLSKFGKINK